LLNRHDYLAWMLLPLLAFNGATSQAAEPSAREQLQRFSQGLETLSANFEQRVLGTDGSLQEQSAGRVWLSRPDFIRWEYGGDFPELVVADGRNIWIYDEVLQQATVKPQSDYAADTPLSLLTDIAALDEQFEVREAGDVDGVLLLELRSRNSEAEFERVLLGLQHDELQSMTMEDAFGLRTEIRFSGLQRNQAIEPGMFSFTPPDGVDVIGEPEAEAGGG
jgi:outer membrane lipoprotein carrier protein